MATATASKQSTSQNQIREAPKYTYIDSFRHWWNKSNLKEAERDVLSLLPFYPESDGRRSADVLDIEIEPNTFVHEFNVKNIEGSENKDAEHVVLIHGYGAALGFFYRNFDDLTDKPGVDLHALDLLGYGLSSRPKLPTTGSKSIEEIQRVEDFFVDSIEKWRQKKNIDQFYLIGHSLGGYLTSLYTLKYPEHVRKLILISPVGVEKSVYDLSASSELENQSDAVEGPDIGQEVGGHFKNTDSPVPKTSSSLHVPDANGYVTRVPNLPKYFTYLWEKNVSPFTIIRSLGPLGPQMTSRWAFKRFGNIKDFSEVLKLHIYSYNTFVAKGSGEYALTRLLAPGALARFPLLGRLPGNLKVESLWLYGDVDWMSKEAGDTIVKEINRQGPSKAGYKIIKGAGHHIYLDNPVDFKKSVFDFFGW